MQTAIMIHFWTAVNDCDWTIVVRDGKRLLHTVAANQRIGLSLQVCKALEKLGRWLEIADPATVGLTACEELGVRDHRYAALLRALGRGQYDRQLYAAAVRTFARLTEWTTTNGSPADMLASQLNTARCLDKSGPAFWLEALKMYDAAFHFAEAEWPDRIAATVNQTELLMKMCRPEAAYEVATTRFLMVPSEQKKGASWAEFLILLTRCLVFRGELESAEMVIVDAIESVPENKPAAAAKAHAVYAQVQSLLGNADEAQGEIELAWTLAEAAPFSNVYQLIREVEDAVKEVAR